jgi:hypothetical protein
VIPLVLAVEIAAVDEIVEALVLVLVVERLLTVVAELIVTAVDEVVAVDSIVDVGPLVDTVFGGVDFRWTYITSIAMTTLYCKPHSAKDRGNDNTDEHGVEENFAALLYPGHVELVLESGRFVREV